MNSTDGLHGSKENKSLCRTGWKVDSLCVFFQPHRLNSAKCVTSIPSNVPTECVWVWSGSVTAWMTVGIIPTKPTVVRMKSVWRNAQTPHTHTHYRIMWNKCTDCTHWIYKLYLYSCKLFVFPQRPSTFIITQQNLRLTVSLLVAAAPTEVPGCSKYFQYECKNGRCIPTWWKCDLENDCGDWSDEYICSGMNIVSSGSRAPSETSEFEQLAAPDLTKLDGSSEHKHE